MKRPAMISGWWAGDGVFVTVSSTSISSNTRTKIPRFLVALRPVPVKWQRRQIADALLIAPVIVVSDEGLDLGFEIAREVIVFEQDTVLECLMPALDEQKLHVAVR